MGDRAVKQKILSPPHISAAGESIAVILEGLELFAWARKGDRARVPDGSQCGFAQIGARLHPAGLADSISE